MNIGKNVGAVSIALVAAATVRLASPIRWDKQESVTTGRTRVAT